jgi:hypothetical protein
MDELISMGFDRAVFFLRKLGPGLFFLWGEFRTILR